MPTSMKIQERDQILNHVTIDEEGCCCVLCIQLGKGLIGFDSKGFKLDEDRGVFFTENGFGLLIPIICTNVKRLRLKYAICFKWY